MASLFYQIRPGKVVEIEVGWFKQKNDGGLSASRIDGGNIMLGPAVPYAVVDREGGQDA